MKPKLNTDLTAKAARAETGIEPNPIFVCCAGAAYETMRALRLFLGETSEETKRQFSDWPKADRDLMVADACAVIAGAGAREIYNNYANSVVWEAADPLERAMWEHYVMSVKLQLAAIQGIAGLMHPAPEGSDNADQ